MSDDELMAMAHRVLFAAAQEKPHSIERAMKFAAYDSVTNEIKRRLAVHLNEQLGMPDVDL
jgi:hypothetical protein